MIFVFGESLHHQKSKKMKVKTILMLFIPAFVVGSLAYSQTKISARSAKVLVSGNSTMHKWSSAVTKLNFSGDFSIVDGNLKKINAAVVRMEVSSMKSHQDSDLMDERTHKTLKAEKFPYITYEYTNTLSAETKGDLSTLKVNGNLTIGGVSKPVDLILKVVNLDNGDVQIKGSRKILMSNHGIKPPSFMAGAIKVDDEIEITFDVILKKINNVNI
jgi:polyisoprenoid-binding protein YceI